MSVLILGLKKRTPTLSHVPAHRKHLLFFQLKHPTTIPTLRWSQANRIFTRKVIARIDLAISGFCSWPFYPFWGYGEGTGAYPSLAWGRAGCTHEGVARSLQTELAPPFSSTQCWLVFWEKAGANSCLGGGLSPTYVGVCDGAVGSPSLNLKHEQIDQKKALLNC